MSTSRAFRGMKLMSVPARRVARDRPGPALLGRSDPWSKRAKKRDQGCFFFARQLHVEPLNMVVNDRCERGPSAIVQVRGAARDTAQPRHFETVHVCPPLREERLTRVAGLQD